MAYLSMTTNNYNVSKNQKEVTVYYNTDVNLTDVKMTYNDGANYLNNTRFTNSSAVFDISSLNGGTYDKCFLKGTYNETVNNNVSVTGVKLNVANYKFTDFTTYQLTATVSPSNATNKKVTWSSNKTSVATVENGLVTAKSNGSAIITVTTSDGNHTAKCNITVAKEESAPSKGDGITLDQSTYRVQPGANFSVTGTFTFTEQNVSWGLYQDSNMLCGGYKSSNNTVYLYASLSEGTYKNCYVVANKWNSSTSSYDIVAKSQPITIIVGGGSRDSDDSSGGESNSGNSGSESSYVQSCTNEYISDKIHSMSQAHEITSNGFSEEATNEQC